MKRNGKYMQVDKIKTQSIVGREMGASVECVVDLWIKVF